MKKTLGGDRLGSGKKQKVELHDYSKSNFDLGYVWRSTMAAGTLVPFMCEVALPGDSWDIELDTLIKTHPTIGPLFASFKIQLDVFEAPLRLYNGALHNNLIGIGNDMSKIKLPTYRINVPKLEDKPKGQQISRSCLLNYLGLSNAGTNEAGNNVHRVFNAVPLLAYWEIYKQYYANLQENEGVMIHTDVVEVPRNVNNIAWMDAIAATNLTAGQMASPPINGGLKPTISVDYEPSIGPFKPKHIIVHTNTGTYSIEQLYTMVSHIPGTWRGNIKPEFLPKYINKWEYVNTMDLPQVPPVLKRFPLESIDQMRNHILDHASKSAQGIPFDIHLMELEPYRSIFMQEGNNYSFELGQEGLAIKCYQSDIFNNWLSEEVISGVNGIAEITAIDTSSGSFTVDALILAKKVYNMLNRIAIAGSTYDDWLDAVYTNARFQRSEMPIYHGGLSKELVFEELVSNAEAEGTGGIQPLGTLAGKGTMAEKHKGGRLTIKVSEPAYIIGIISLTPRLDYSQGNRFFVNMESVNDLHKSALDGIGFQDLIMEQMAAESTYWDTNNTRWVQRSAGKQTSWMNYQTNYNRTFGNFAELNENGQAFMTLNRRYNVNPLTGNIIDLTTYIDPVKCNYVFAQTSLDAQNFWAQVKIDANVRRIMAAKQIPNL